MDSDGSHGSISNSKTIFKAMMFKQDREEHTDKEK